MSQNVESFLSQTRITDPGTASSLITALPDGVPAAVQVVQSLFTHIFWAERYGVTPNAEQKTHVNARTVERILEVVQALDPSPLTVARPLARRFYGNCRDHSVLLCSILRAKGIPARARCGFGTYFTPNEWYEDHWICEYWNGERWVNVDPQLDELQVRTLRVEFDPQDMPAGEFVPASTGWLMCRAGQADPDRFGIFDMHGLWFVRGNLLRELAALNGAEMLPWDVWGLMTVDQDALSEADLELLDAVARALQSDDTAEIHRLYAADDRLRVPAEMMVAGI